MATIKFYPDKPFKSGSDQKEKEEIKRIVKEHKKDRRYPNKILNDRETSIYLFFTAERGAQFKIRTPHRVLAQKWDFKAGKLKKGYSETLEFNDALQKLKGKLTKVYRELTEDETQRIYLDDLKAAFEPIVKNLPVNEKQQSEGERFFEVMDKFIEVSRHEQSPRTIQKYVTLKNSLQEFKETKKGIEVSFEKMDLNFYDSYVYYLRNLKNVKRGGEKGLLNDTIAKYISTLKQFMTWALERKHHDNVEFKKFKAVRRPKNEIVTLNDHELRHFYNFEFQDKRLERARDLFCFAVFTGQRWGDIENFNRENINQELKYDSDGGEYVIPVWVFIAQKTGKITRVPLIGFSKPAMDILRKYNHELPVISSQKFNLNIKDAAEVADLDRVVNIKRYIGKKELVIEKPIHEFISSHMARRTAVTILLERGVAPTTVMKLTGHTDLKTLMKYENSSEEALTRELERVGELGETKMIVNK